MKKVILTASVLSFLLINKAAFSQEVATNDSTNFLDMSIEDLMNVKIVSASRKSEKVFEAPVTSFVISKQDIANSGVLSIAEALRLCPSVIVRENSTGSYDVSIRGGSDGLPTYQYGNNNTTILAMIDNRPVFNNFQGGTYWANLPIALIDVERIEVVVGASAPLYGPNAVSGVVNIITKKLDKDGTNVHANVQYGLNNSVISNVFAGYKVNSKFDIGFSANGIARKRTNIDYYDHQQDKFVDQKDYKNTSVANTNLYYMGDKNLGHTQTGVNLFSNFNPTDKVKFMGNVGYNNSKTLTPFFNTETQLSHFSNESYNAYLKGEIHNFNLQASYNGGRQSFGGNNGPYRYDYRTTDLYLDYNLNVTKTLTLKPAVSYQNAYITDKKYTVDQNRVGAFNGSGEMENYASSLKADLNLDKFRIIAAGRVDKFTYPDKAYFSYQFIGNYKPTPNDNFRAVVGRSYQGSFIANTFVDFRAFTSQLAIDPQLPTIPNTVYVKGNKDLKLMQNMMYEFGYRRNISKIAIVDLSLSRQEFSNFASTILNAPVLGGFYELMPGLIVPGSASTTAQIENIDLKAVQHSATLAVSASLLESKLTIKPNITIQKTEVSNYSPNYASDTNIFQNNVKTYKAIGFKTTPSVYGGMLVSYKINPKLIIASQFYGYTAYQLTTNALTGGQPTPDEIKSSPNSEIQKKLLVNLTLSYKLLPKLTVTANARNIFNQNARENFGTDKIGSLYLLGLNFEY